MEMAVMFHSSWSNEINRKGLIYEVGENKNKRK